MTIIVESEVRAIRSAEEFSYAPEQIIRGRGGIPVENAHRWDLSYTQNRELSWLKFNERVLLEAADPTVPLIERLRFALPGCNIIFE